MILLLSLVGALKDLFENEKSQSKGNVRFCLGWVFLLLMPNSSRASLQTLSAPVSLGFEWKAAERQMAQSKQEWLGLGSAMSLARPEPWSFDREGSDKKNSSQSGSNTMKKIAPFIESTHPRPLPESLDWNFFLVHHH